MPLTESISVVIPVYNSEKSLPILIQRLSEYLPRVASRYEVVLVNDGSRDQSGNVLSQLSSKYSFVTGINLMRNYGQHNALLCGIRQARHDVIVTMDDDLQHPVQEIEKLLAKMQEGYDVVYGFPEKERHGFWRDMASQITKIVLQNAMGSEVARHISAFRAFRTSLRNAFSDYQSSFVCIDVLLTWGTTRFALVPTQHEKREIGASNYTLKKLMIHALNMMTGFSTLPLQIASVVGFVFTLFGILILFYVIGRYLIQGGSVPGFPFLASIIAIFAGAQLFALGIIGEYLARIHFRMMDRPAYTVGQMTRKQDEVFAS